MTAKAANRRSRLRTLLIQSVPIALFAILVIALLGAGGITVYAVSAGTFTEPGPQPLPPRTEPAAAQIIAAPQWQITTPVIVWVQYNQGWRFTRILAADIIENDGVIDAIKARYSPLGDSHITARLSRRYAERLLELTGSDSHLTPGYRNWRIGTADHKQNEAKVSARIVIKQRLYPTQALAAAATGLAILAVHCAAILLGITCWVFRNGAAAQTESADEQTGPRRTATP